MGWPRSIGKSGRFADSRWYDRACADWDDCQAVGTPVFVAPKTLRRTEPREAIPWEAGTVIASDVDGMLIRMWNDERIVRLDACDGVGQIRPLPPSQALAARKPQWRIP